MMTAPATGTQLTVPAAPPVCGRCGSFVQGGRVSVGPLSVCAPCAAQLQAEQNPVRLYPTAYIVAIGVLANCLLAGILAAVDWKRLGEPRRAQAAVLAAVAMLAAGVVLMATVPSFPFAVFFAMNALGTVLAAAGLGPRYRRHREAGGPRANVWWPVLVILVLLAIELAVNGANPQALLLKPPAG